MSLFRAATDLLRRSPDHYRALQDPCPLMLRNQTAKFKRERAGTDLNAQLTELLRAVAAIDCETLQYRALRCALLAYRQCRRLQRLAPDFAPAARLIPHTVSGEVERFFAR